MKGKVGTFMARRAVGSRAAPVLLYLCSLDAPARNTRMDGYGLLHAVHREGALPCPALPCSRRPVQGEPLVTVRTDGTVSLSRQGTRVG